MERDERDLICVSEAIFSFLRGQKKMKFPNFNVLCTLVRPVCAHLSSMVFSEVYNKSCRLPTGFVD